VDDDWLTRLRDRLLEQGGMSVFPRPIPSGPRADAQLERLRPFAEVVFLVIIADGVVRDGERAALRGTLRTLTGGALGTAAADAMLEQLQAAHAAEGLEGRLDRVASELYGSREDAELALSLALAAAISDGQESPVEHDVVQQLSERLGMSEAQLRKLHAQQG
jgi:tellurite resistance protein